VKRKFLLYELNEVPWTVLDRYVASRPNSATAALLERSTQRTTVNSDDVALEPWRAWPTLHRSMLTRAHNSFDLGQDPESFQGTDVWKAAIDSGCSVGVFGALQSWPVIDPGAGSFYVPDTFAPDADTYPKALEPLQGLNVGATGSNRFNSAGRVTRSQALGLIRATLSRPAGWRVGWTLCEQLVAERRDPVAKARRPTMQLWPNYLAFEQQYLKMRPDLSIFFTNHVAAVMHRYWGDAFEDYPYSDDYQSDPRCSDFVFYAMDQFDLTISRVMKHIGGRQDTTLMVLGGIGQGPIPPKQALETYVLADETLLLKALGLEDGRPGHAMYPSYVFDFGSEDRARHAARTLLGLTTDLGPLFPEVRQNGTTTSVIILSTYHRDVPEMAGLSGEIRMGDDSDRTFAVEELGVTRAARSGGVNTAHHIPEAPLLVFRPTEEPVAAYRAEVDVLDVAPSILKALGVDVPLSMHGSPSLEF
jgi:hypothetical protein